MSALSRRDNLLLALGALAVRVLYMAEHARSPFYAVPLLDQKYYDLFARTIVLGGDWSDFGGFRPLLYPLFLAGVYALGSLAYRIARAVLVQHLLGVLATLLVARGSASLFNSRKAGLFAGALFALSGPPLFFEGELLIESILPCLVAALLLAHLAAARKAGAAGWIVAGACLAIACQARPNFLVLWAAYPALAAIRFLRTRTRTAWIPLAGLASAIALQALFGALNMKQAGGFHLVTSAGGINLYLGNNRKADGMVPRQAWSVTYQGEYRDPIDEYARQAYALALREQGREPSPDARAVSDYWTQRTFEEIRAAPAAWLGLLARKTWFLLWNYEAPNNTSYLFVRDHESRVLRLMPVTWALLLGLLPAALWLSFRQPERDGPAFVALYLLLYAATIVLFFVNGRFRIPLWPALALLGGGTLAHLADRAAARDWKSAAAHAAVITAIAGLSTLNLAGAQKPDYARDFLFRSYALYAQARYDEARADIDRSLALDPSDVNAIFHAGNVAFSQNRLDDALAAYRAATALNPNEPRAWNNLGATYDLLGDFSAAYQAYTQSLSLAPNQDAILNLALLELRAGRTAAAAARLADVAGMDRNVIYLCVRSRLARLGGQNGEAAALENEARRQDPATAEGLFRLIEENAQHPIDLGDGS